MRKPSARRSYSRGPHLYERDGVWYAYLPEKPKGTSLKTRDKAEANRKFRELLSQPGRVQMGPVSLQEVALDELAETYLAAPHGWTRSTINSTRVRVVAFGKWCESKGVMYASQITEPLMDMWLREREGKVSRRTINRDLRAAKRFMAFGVARNLCRPCEALTGRSYVREAKRSKVRYVPDANEASRAFIFLERIHLGACLAAKVLYGTGLRIEELRRLTPFDVRGGTVHVVPEAGPADTAEPTKGYRERAIPIAPQIESIVQKFLSWRSGKGGKGKRVGCTESWLIKNVHAACAQAKVHKFGLHDLRAAFATEAFDKGVGLVVIQRWLGHADPQTTQGYIRPRRSDAAVKAPIPGGLLTADSVQKDGVLSGRIQSDTHEVVMSQVVEIIASPAEVESATNGLGNRKKRGKP